MREEETMIIERDLIINAVVPDSLDVAPRGNSCFAIQGTGCVFFLNVEAAGFTYNLCNRCGTVRIKEILP
jgi:hypothetical protein